MLANYPAGTRMIARRNAPTRVRRWTCSTVNGMRHQIFATDTRLEGGSLQYLEAGHRAHARVEDRIQFAA